jgi:hypothetical protein
VICAKLALDQFHREEMLAVNLANFVDRNDARMLQTCHRLGFRAETAYVIGPGELAGPDHLHGHEPIQTPLPAAPDHAHAARADLLQQLVVAKDPRCGGKEWFQQVEQERPRRRPRAVAVHRHPS